MRIFLFAQTTDDAHCCLTEGWGHEAQCHLTWLCYVLCGKTVTFPLPCVWLPDFKLCIKQTYSSTSRKVTRMGYGGPRKQDKADQNITTLCLHPHSDFTELPLTPQQHTSLRCSDEPKLLASQYFHPLNRAFSGGQSIHRCSLHHKLP